MNNRDFKINEAERLYVQSFYTVNELADRLGVNFKTIMAWKEKFDWDRKRKAFFRAKQSFHEELYEFARKLMRDITADIDAGEKVDPGRMYAFCRVIPMFAKVKDYEDVVYQKEPAKETKGLTPELIAQIEEEVLGIKHNDDNTETE